MSAYQIELIHNLNALDPAQWNAVTGDTLQMGYRWQKYKQVSQEQAWPGAWTAVIAVRHQHQLVGVATAYRYAIPFPFASSVLRNVSRILLWPANPINFLLPPTVAASAEAAVVFPMLLDGIRRLGWKRPSFGTRLTFLEQARHGPLLHHLHQANYAISEGIWQNELAVEWDTFDGYVQSLRSTPRKQLRKQQENAAGAGITITTAPPADPVPVYQLFANVAHKNHSRLLFNSQFLAHANAVLGANHFTLFRAVHAQQTVACLLMFHDATTAQLTAIGLDYDFSLTYNLYRVLIYAAIENCIERHIQRIIGGMSRYALKKRIGFESKPTLTAVHAWLPPFKRYYSFTPQTLQDR